MLNFDWNTVVSKASKRQIANTEFVWSFKEDNFLVFNSPGTDPEDSPSLAVADFLEGRDYENDEYYTGAFIDDLEDNLTKFEGSNWGISHELYYYGDFTDTPTPYTNGLVALFSWGYGTLKVNGAEQLLCFEGFVTEEGAIETLNSISYIFAKEVRKIGKNGFSGYIVSPN